MIKNSRFKYIAAAGFSLICGACSTPALVQKEVNKNVPEAYGATAVADSSNAAAIQWRSFFADVSLQKLIDTALANNQEMNILLQEIQISKNEIREEKGEYLPSVGVRAGAGVDKVGRYTSRGASEEISEITPGKEIPEPLPDYLLGLEASWEVDIWNKLHNAKKAAVSRYLASVEGRNFLQTNLVAEIANSYYELLALDNQLEIVKKNIDIQKNAYQIVKYQKEAAEATELAVKRFEAQVLNTQNLQYEISQKITETENKINYLLGRYPQHIERSSTLFSNMVPQMVNVGIPSQLLENRPDIREAELELAAAKLDVKSAKARFYPSLEISAAIGYQAFNPSYFLKTPESLVYSLGGELLAPLVNRNAIKAAYSSANAKQLQTVYEYEKRILNAYVEVANQVSKVYNLQQSYDLKSKQVAALTASVDISNQLFRSARADYMEVLLTQREALESKFELIETQKERMNAVVNIYRALGGGWN